MNMLHRTRARARCAGPEALAALRKGGKGPWSFTALAAAPPPAMAPAPPPAKAPAPPPAAPMFAHMMPQKAQEVAKEKKESSR